MKREISVEKIELLYGIINIIEILTIIILIGYYKIFTSKIQEAHIGNRFKVIILLGGIFLIFNIGVGINNFFILKRYGRRLKMQGENIDRIHKLNNTLRAQRHDFLNNLQVVYSLIQMEDYKDAGEYIEEVYKDIKKVSRVLRTSNAAVNALLQAKIADAEKNKIQVSLDITTRLEMLNKDAWEICRILSNLLDNAIFELKTQSSEEKKIKIKLHEELNEYVFSISNNGPRIPEEIIKKIFKPNFTTKGSKGQGMGLAITRELAQKHSGDINVKSDDSDTEFTVRIPISVLK